MREQKIVIHNHNVRFGSNLSSFIKIALVIKVAVGSYQILNRAQKFKLVTPMTVYRALKSLTDDGLIHKTNKNKTFHLCNTTGEHDHNAVLAVCNDCGFAEELNNSIFYKIIKNVK